MHLSAAWQRARNNKLKTTLAFVFFGSLFPVLAFFYLAFFHDHIANVLEGKSLSILIPMYFSLSIAILGFVFFVLGVKFKKLLFVVLLLLIVPMAINAAGICIVSGKRFSDEEIMTTFLTKFNKTKQLRIDGKMWDRIPYASIEELKRRNPGCCEGTEEIVNFLQDSEVLHDNCQESSLPYRIFATIVGSQRGVYYIVLKENVIDSETAEKREVLVKKRYIATNCGFKSTSIQELERF